MPRALAVPAATLVAAAAALFPATARAALVISSDATAGVTCASGACAATTADAVLNVSDLETLLAAGPVVVRSGAVAGDLVVSAPLAFGHAQLTLDAYGSLEIDSPVHARAGVALDLEADDGGKDGELTFGGGGHLDMNLSDGLTIDGWGYELVDSVAAIAAAYARDPHVYVALAADYDASADGTYARTPVPSQVGAVFEGLGHTVSNLSINDTVDGDVALFASLGRHGVLRDVGVVNVHIMSENTFNQDIAGLVAFSEGAVVHCYATGLIRSDFLVTAGGLVSISYGSVHGSWADVNVQGAENAEVGGLIGNSHGRISDVYATGPVIAGDQSSVGGLIGYSLSEVSDAYATGSVSGGQGAFVGGLLGQDNPPATTTKGYWDTTTSGTTFGIGGANVTGITGLTTTQLTAGLPAGFHKSTWAQSAAVNGGMPYLKAAPLR